MEMKTISRAFWIGSALEVMVEFRQNYPRGLAVDWLVGNLKLAHAGTGRVEVATFEDSSRRVFVWRELKSHECLVVDMKGVKIVWSSWGLELVTERAALDTCFNRERLEQLLLVKLGHKKRKENVPAYSIPSQSFSLCDFEMKLLGIVKTKVGVKTFVLG
jgi:hypothetical protein